MVEEDQESDQIGSEGPAIAGDATPEFAALSDIDQSLINSLQSWDWDTQPWVSADIESINVPEGTDFSVTLTLENFTESPIYCLSMYYNFCLGFLRRPGRPTAVLPTCYSHLRQRRCRCDHYYLNRRGHMLGCWRLRNRARFPLYTLRRPRWLLLCRLC